MKSFYEPVYHYYFKGKCCAEFDEGVGRVKEDYTRFCPQCPFHYMSNQTSLCKRKILWSVRFSPYNYLFIYSFLFSLDSDCSTTCPKKNVRDKREVDCNHSQKKSSVPTTLSSTDSSRNETEKSENKFRILRYIHVYVHWFAYNWFRFWYRKKIRLILGSFDNYY